MAQFPLSDLLSGARRIYTTIMARKDDGTYQEMNIDNNGGIKAAVVTELPPGTNNIGSVNVGSMPEVAIVNNAENIPINTSKATNGTASVVLQNAAIAAGAGNLFTVSGYSTLTIEITGTSTSRTVVFQGKGPSGTPIAIVGTKLNDGSTGSQTTGTGELWRFNVTGLTSFQANVTGVAGGNVTVSGTAVA